MSQMLQVAVQNGDVRTVRKLLKSDTIDPNAVDENGVSPLHLAVRNGHVKIVHELLKIE